MIVQVFQSILFITAIVAGVCLANPTPSLTTNSVQVASLFSFSGEQPENLGVKNGQLTECPKTPNCVSSQSRDVTHKVDPLTYDSSRKKALNQLKTILKETNNAEIIEFKPHYIYSQFTSRIMGFVDDVEFYLPLQEKIIHVRSASRVGQSDLGVNRRRIETIREQFQA